MCSGDIGSSEDHSLENTVHVGQNFKVDFLRK